jgi:hypothetical protein
MLFSSLEVRRPKEEEGAPKNRRNGRHQENIETKTEVFMLSSMFPFPLLLEILFLPLPGLHTQTSSSKPTQVHFYCVHWNNFSGPRKRKEHL